MSNGKDSDGPLSDKDQQDQDTEKQAAKRSIPRLQSLRMTRRPDDCPLQRRHSLPVSVSCRWSGQAKTKRSSTVGVGAAARTGQQKDHKKPVKDQPAENKHSPAKFATVVVGRKGDSNVFRIDKTKLSATYPGFEANVFNDSNGRKKLISDLTPRGFKRLVSFISSGDTTLDNIDELTETWKAAKKFDVQPLEGKCINFVEENLSSSTALKIYDVVKTFDNREFTIKCLNIFSRETKKVLNAASFNDATLTSLTALVQCPWLCLESEAELISAVFQWGKAECRRQGMDPTAANVKSVLQPLLTHLRILSLSVEEFGRLVMPEDIFTLTEKGALLINLVYQKGGPIPRDLSKDKESRVFKGFVKWDDGSRGQGRVDVKKGTVFRASIKVTEGTCQVVEVGYCFQDAVEVTATVQITLERKSSVHSREQTVAFTEQITKFGHFEYSTRCQPLMLEHNDLLLITAVVVKCSPKAVVSDVVLQRTVAYCNEFLTVKKIPFASYIAYHIPLLCLVYR